MPKEVKSYASPVVVIFLSNMGIGEDRAREKSWEGELESGLLLDSLWSMGTDKTYQGKEIKECENSCAHNFEVVLVLE